MFGLLGGLLTSVLPVALGAAGLPVWGLGLALVGSTLVKLRGNNAQQQALRQNSAFYQEQMAVNNQINVQNRLALEKRKSWAMTEAKLLTERTIHSQRVAFSNRGIDPNLGSPSFIYAETKNMEAMQLQQIDEDYSIRIKNSELATNLANVQAKAGISANNMRSDLLNLDNFSTGLDFGSQLRAFTPLDIPSSPINLRNS